MAQVPNIRNKNKREILQLRGINYSNILRDGDLADCKNISASKFPYITTAKNTTALSGTGYEHVKAMTSYQNLITFAVNNIYLDGNQFTALPTSEKQIAIVNGKMMVLPDQMLVSLQNKYIMPSDNNNVTDLNKLITYLNKKEIYAGGTHYFFPAFSGVKTVQQINVDEFHDQQETAYTYYQMGNGGDILTGQEKTPVQVKKEDIAGVKYSSSGDIYFKSAEKVSNYGGVIDNLPSFSETNVPAKFYILSGSLVLAIYQEEQVYYKRVWSASSSNYTEASVEFINSLTLYSTGQIGSVFYKIVGGAGEIIYGDGGQSVLPVNDGDIVQVTYADHTRKYVLHTTAYEHTEKTVEEINAQQYTEESASAEYCIITTGGNIKYGVDNQNMLPVVTGDLITIAYDQTKTVYYKNAAKITSTPDDLSKVGITRDTADWLYVINGKSNVMNGITKYGLHFTKGNDFEMLSVSLGENETIKKSIASIDVQCTARSLVENSQWLGTYNTTLDGFLSADDTVQIKHGLTTETKNVATVRNNTAVITDFVPVVGQWYTFSLLEDPDFCCEWANRLWCCNNDKQLIYASSQGKPDDFLSDFDSAIGAYQVTIGDVEPFTGCTKYESSILFFKQNRIYKILGSSPKNYEIFTYETEGVKQGCHKSICTIDGILYYVGLHGVYAYSGGTPMLISSNLGHMEMENAVGGTDGERYYLSFTSKGKDYLFTYEPRYNIWLLRDNIKVVDFARKLEEFYYLDKNTEKVVKMDTADTPDDMEWYAQFTPFYETIDGKKRYTKLIIRYELGNKSHMTVKMRVDDGIWQEVQKLTAHNKKDTQELILPVMRCDKFELRLEGKGKATILEIAREFEVGSGV